ncbi:monocarboxylate transporter 11-like [Amphiura filiformis]|uniref:monocarboxylate transporter 11-like n=1 Tax=Amphiura filiformis TaxID=82378 RepID=UPI003B21219F
METPPDGGWGWMVVVGAVVFQAFNVGIHKGLGVFVPEFSEGLEMSIGAVGTICGVAVGLKAILGPVWSACVPLINTRTLIILGGILTGLGLIVAGLSTNQIHLMLGMVISSCGFGLPAVAVYRTVKDYFHKKYSLAVGLVYSGSAIGMILFPPVVEFVIATYGWRNALFLLGASCFNICAVGVSFRPVRSSSESRGRCQCLDFCRSKVNIYADILTYTGIDF